MKRLLLLAAVVWAAVSCTPNRSLRMEDFSEAVYSPRYASGFEMLRTKEGASTLLRVHNPWQGAGEVATELLIRRNDEPIPAGYAGEVLEGAAERIVCLSSTYVAMLDALDEVERVVGVSGIDFVSNDYVQANRSTIGDVGYDGHLNYELLVALDPDLVLLYGVNSASEMEAKLRELKIPYAYIGEYLEQSPLGKAEWMIFIGELIGRRTEAEERFRPVPERYEALRSEAATVAHRPRVMLNTPYRDAWFMPSVENYAVRLITDAGGSYLFPENRSNRSEAIDLERAFLLCSEADFWLNLGSVDSRDELRRLYPRFATVRCVEQGALWNNTRRMNAAGGNDFWESGVVHPDWVLADLIRILHPELLPDHQFVYYKPLE